MKKYNCFLILLAILIVMGCSNGSTPKSGKLAKFNVGDATALMASSNTNFGISLNRVNSDGSPETFYKKTVDGYVKEISYLDENGDEVILQEYPLGMIVVDEKYTVLLFEWNSALVYNDTGNVVEISVVPKTGFDLYQNYANDPLVKYTNDTLYFVSQRLDGQYQSNVINKIDILDNAVSESEINTDFSKNIDTFAVTSGGAMIYQYNILDGYESDPDSFNCEVRLADGNIVIIEDSSGHLGPQMWVDANNNMCWTAEVVVEAPGGWEYTKTLKVFNESGTMIAHTTLVRSYALGLNSSMHVFDFAGRSIITDGTNGYSIDSNTYIISELSNLPTAFEVDVKMMAVASDDMIYMVGKSDPLNYQATSEELSTIYVYDPVAESTTILTTDVIEFDAIDVNDAEVVTFSGKLISNGSLVVGEISDAGVITVMDETTGVMNQIDNVN